ncbi:MAG: hypothetical protein VX024_02325, partial [SAR324 cluster bacterium]|nr:hypothetical protein [SAR324 cluster bacterium]
KLVNLLNMFPPRKFFRFFLRQQRRVNIPLLCRRQQDSGKCDETIHVSSYSSKSTPLGVA